MKLVFITAGLALLAVSAPAQAVVYCQYVGVPKGCVARPGVALRAAPGVGVRAGPAGTANLGGPVNRAGAR